MQRPTTMHRRQNDGTETRYEHIFFSSWIINDFLNYIKKLINNSWGNTKEMNA
jgi:hypothetical protein